VLSCGFEANGLDERIEIIDDAVVEAILVAKGTSRELNPSLPQRVIDRALERDQTAASAEYLAEFRTDLEAFVPLEVVRACVSMDVRERSPLPGLAYSLFAIRVEARPTR
jgi:hypothetical protein